MLGKWGLDKCMLVGHLDCKCCSGTRKNARKHVIWPMPSTLFRIYCPQIAKSGPRHPTKMLFGVFPGPFSAISMDLHFLLSILLNVNFHKWVFVENGEMVVSKVVQSTVSTPTITVYGGSWLHMPLNYWKKSIFWPVWHGINQECICLPLHHSKNPNLRKIFNKLYISNWKYIVHRTLYKWNCFYHP